MGRLMMDPDKAMQIAQEFERMFPLEFKVVMLILANRQQDFEIRKLNSIINEKDLRIGDLTEAMKGQ